MVPYSTVQAPLQDDTSCPRAKYKSAGVERSPALQPSRGAGELLTQTFCELWSQNEKKSPTIQERLRKKNRHSEYKMNTKEMGTKSWQQKHRAVGIGEGGKVRIRYPSRSLVSKPLTRTHWMTEGSPRERHYSSPNMMVRKCKLSTSRAPAMAGFTDPTTEFLKGCFKAISTIPLSLLALPLASPPR